MSARGRIALVATVTVAVIAVCAAPAFAHAELRPDRGAAGSVAAAQLFVENEQSDAGTVKVQLHFPENQPVTLAALPAAPGWTTTIEGGAVGTPVTDVIWSRATAQPGDVVVPLSLGPLPDRATRLQFKVLQTYSNGVVDRWIEDWPEGTPEPDMPGPVFAVTGSVAPATTTVPPTTTPATTVPATSPPTTAAPEQSSDDSNTALVLIVVAIVIVVGGGTAAFVVRRRRAARS